MNAEEVKDAARRSGADLVGITSLARFEGVAQERDPRNIFSRGKSLIMIGRRIPRGLVRSVEHSGSAKNSFRDFGF